MFAVIDVYVTYKADYLTDKQKTQKILRIMCSNTCGISLEKEFPVPVVSSFIGHVLGALIGDAIFYGRKSSLECMPRSVFFN